MLFLRSLIAAALASHALAVSMTDRFTVSSTCDLAEIDAMLAETIDMTQTAIGAIDTLLAAKFGLSSISGSKKTAAFWKAANYAFGVALPGTFTYSLSAADKIQLQKAQVYYQALYNTLQNGIDISPSENYFYCDSSTLQWTTIASDIWSFATQGQTIESLFQDQGVYGITGLWKDPDHKNGNDYNWIKDEYNGSPICGPSVAEGITYSKTPAKMFLCPKAFDTTNYLTSLSSLRTTTSQRTWAQTRSLPGVFLHEMMHWLPVQPHVTDETLLDDNGNPMPAYGVIPVWSLAGNGGGGNKAKTLTNADSYNVFATMVYLPGISFIG